MIIKLTTVCAVALITLAPLGVDETASAGVPKCHGHRATIVGTNKNDVIRGTAERDVIIAKGGNDRIRARGGDDIICADTGKDAVVGGAGDDIVFGGAGNDQLDGGAGDDRLRGGDENDGLRGGVGSDRLYGEDGNDVLDTGRGTKDFAFGGDHADDITVAAAQGFANGEDGNDSLLTTASGTHLAGGNGDDSLTGSRYDDQLDGLAGDDLIEAGGGADTCTGGPGDDLCDGGSPGGAQNTPSDPDICDDTVEEKQSCRVDRPDAYVGTISGFDIEPLADDEGTWSMQVRFIFDADTGQHYWYKLESGTVSWSLNGDNGDCTWSQHASGLPLDPDSGHIKLDKVRRTYELNMGYNKPLPESVWHCEDLTFPHAEPWRPGNVVLDVPWAASHPRLTADLVVPDAMDAPDTVRWDLEPVYNQ